VQKRLLAFGFDPGPIDGVPGRQTQIATQHYLEARGEPQMPPTEPQLLENLRQDPAPTVAPPSPQVAQRATQSDGYGAQAAQQRRSFDPFQPVKLAGAEITRWLQSAFR
jgi:peptidoglycan hydrolase-like protein with peptidoglycan-binding domain